MKQNNLLGNIKGNLLSVWWFAILVTVSAGIVLGVSFFYSISLDTRSVEANILSDKIADCLSKQTPENIEFIKSFDIFSKCGLNKNVFENGSNFYINVSVFNGEKTESVQFGKTSIGKDCLISNSVNAKYFPQCYENDLVIYDKDKNALNIIIITGSNNDGGVL
jgi:hypothetical protein